MELGRRVISLYNEHNQSMLVFNKLHPIDKSKIINILESTKKFILLKIIFHQMDYMILYASL